MSETAALFLYISSKLEIEPSDFAAQKSRLYQTRCQMAGVDLPR